MKNIKIGIYLLAGLAGLSACDNGKKTTASGYEYQEIENTDSQVAQDGEFLVLNMKFVDQNDSAWINTAENGIPRVIIKQDSAWRAGQRPLEEMLLDVGEGDSLKITLPASELFSGGPMPQGIAAEDDFTIYVGVQSVLNEEEFQGWQQEMAEKQQQLAQQKQLEAEEERAGQHEKDKQILSDYFEENNIEVQSTESGISYVIKEEGSGAQPQRGDEVRVNYTGYVLNGEYFDTSIKEIAEERGLFMPNRTYEPISFTIGNREVIQGWDEGIAQLKEGTKATLYIPSTMAYGPRQRSEQIGPNSILVFDVELVEVIENENN